MPAFLRLMRLHQPVGIWLLFWPCAWALALAGGELRHYLLFFLGAVVMRSAGCIINDIADREFDAQVERTQNRPLANGEMTVRQALALLLALLFIAAWIAVALGEKALLLSACSLGLVAAYPYMKRFTFWPQLFLGLTFNWGALVGWVAVRGDIEWPAIVLYAGGMFWTLGYDTIYAHQDKRDDARIGVKSTALRLGERTKQAVGIFYLLATLAWALAAWLAGSGLLSFAVLILVQLHFSWQLCTVDLENPASCRRVFLSNAWLGGLILGGFLSRWVF